MRHFSMTAAAMSALVSLSVACPRRHRAGHKAEPEVEVPEVEVPEPDAQVDIEPDVQTDVAQPKPTRTTDAVTEPSGEAGTSLSGDIWQPEVGTTWQIMLSKTLTIDGSTDKLTPDVEVYDLDLFDNDAETFAALHDMGKKVICYFSAGTYEDWRDDMDSLDPQAKGKAMEDWDGEYWLDLGSENVRGIMAERIQLAADKGCDAVDPDNVDGYLHDTGFDLQMADSISFVNFLADEAHKLDLAVGLKNGAEIVDEVLDNVDFQVNEQCSDYNECAVFEKFIDADKPVFHIAYPDSAPDVTDSDMEAVCNAEGAAEFSTIIKKMNVDGWTLYCDGTTYETV